ncbi:MAG: ATP-binding protein [Bacteroidales bacterium]|nr:ATP-binding protein [Bacteroidales bacterium]
MDEKLARLQHYNLWDGRQIDSGFPRTLYTDRILKATGNHLVKVLIGQRRVGKSYLLRQTAQQLIAQGVAPTNIFMLNKEYEDFDFVANHTDLDQLFQIYLSTIKPEGKVYLLLDEIQNVDAWERFVNSYSQDYTRQYELFITGSNSKMLSGELATLLSGRYIEMEVQPFSYDEYLGYHHKERGRGTYLEYLHTTGLPEVYRLTDEETRRYYVRSLKNTVLLRDIISRNNVRDVALLEDLFVYIVNNASNLLSVTNIVKYLKGQGRKVSYDTIATYLQYFEDTFLAFSAKRYNIKGKTLVGGPAKYYLNDLAFHNYLYRGFGYGEGYLLENAVYCELRRRGLDVYVGSNEDKEVDFVAIEGDRKVYVQVAYSVGDEATARREYSALEAIKDSYEKYVVTLDEFTLPINEGIRHVQPWHLPLI